MKVKKNTECRYEATRWVYEQERTEEFLSSWNDNRRGTQAIQVPTVFNKKTKFKKTSGTLKKDFFILRLKKCLGPFNFIIPTNKLLYYLGKSIRWDFYQVYYVLTHKGYTIHHLKSLELASHLWCGPFSGILYVNFDDVSL